jgi:hypothetical protein
MAAKNALQRAFFLIPEHESGDRENRNPELIFAGFCLLSEVSQA